MKNLVVTGISRAATRIFRVGLACFTNATWWAVLVFILCGVGSAFLIQSVVLDLEEHRSAVEDRVLWNISQAEVELTTLQIAIANSMESPDAAQLTRIRRSFDIFFSRVSTIEEGTGFSGLRQEERFARGLADVRIYLDEAVTLIDSPDPVLAATLPQLKKLTQAARGAVRQMSLDTVRNRTLFADGLREQLVTTLLRLGALAVLLILALMLSTLFVLRLSKSAELRAQRIGETNSRIEEILSRTNRAVITVDSFGAILDYNRAAEEMFELPRDGVLGKLLKDVPLDPGIKNAIERLMSGSRHETEIAEHLAESIKYASRSDGSQFPVEVSMSVINGPAGRSVLVWVADITPRLVREQELNEALERAVAGETTKARMLNVMSHEIRTPLNGLLGALQVLSDTELTARQQKIVQAMNTSSDILLSHVNSVLEISQLDAGSIESAREPFDLKEVAEQVVENQIHAARQRGNALIVEEVGARSTPLLGDPRRIRQILINLVSNANKFTQSGEIRIRLCEDDALEFARIEVCDTGIGIAEENLERIFEDFVTIDTSYERRAEGTGLGLGLCRRLAEMMGGTLTVESRIGGGSVFRLSLPLRRTGVEERAEAAEAQIRAGQPNVVTAQRTLRILLAEDNSINLEIMTDMLTADGHRVYCALDGEQAVARAQAEPFDVILMDISMPRQNGVEATRKIRAGTGPCRDVPILAVTAHAQKSEIDKFLMAGMTGAIVKPVSRGRLREMLADPSIRSQARPQPEHAPMDMTTLGDLIEALGREKIARILGEVDNGVESFAEMLSQGIQAGTRMDSLPMEAHKLAGAVALLGATSLREDLVGLEHLLREPGSARDIRALARDMRADWRAAKSMIEDAISATNEGRARSA
ncbi:ATP-binding protein [Defluviimonas sp. WL0002]|uniref:histidine kinase n=1 Tax=Albidovulum marisflavi TaxID=2984159 RepID=A0ABT2ZCE9_9RHOB|nr:PAS domain-containing hybrid sensor histidine kinase/response regulator [Defluviimonas sp. WL0002]MCV2868426.1 ATP-binding protein [Defluviimonas sp. WL0002]